MTGASSRALLMGRYAYVITVLHGVALATTNSMIWSAFVIYGFETGHPFADTGRGSSDYRQTR